MDPIRDKKYLVNPYFFLEEGVVDEPSLQDVDAFKKKPFEWQYMITNEIWSGIVPLVLQLGCNRMIVRGWNFMPQRIVLFFNPTQRTAFLIAVNFIGGYAFKRVLNKFFIKKSTALMKQNMTNFFVKKPTEKVVSLFLDFQQLQKKTLPIINRLPREFQTVIVRLDEKIILFFKIHNSNLFKKEDVIVKKIIVLSSRIARCFFRKLKTDPDLF